MKKEFPSVPDYIAKSPKWAQGALKEIRRAIRAAAPKAKESISYHMPYYSQNGRLAYFSAFTKHCSFFWVSASDKKNFAKEFTSEKVVGQTLQIPAGAKVPVSLIKKIVRSRVKQNEARKNES